jgi:hypothetical protein
MESLKSLLDTIGGTNVGKSFIIGTFMALVTTLIILAGNSHIQSTWPYVAPQTPAWYAGVYAVSTLLFMYIFFKLFSNEVAIERREGTVTEREKQATKREEAATLKDTELSKRDGEDYLTPIREALKGRWDADYESFGYNPQGELEKLRYEINATFGISAQKKLTLTFKWRFHPVFPDGSLTINNISLSAESPPERMIWYTEASLPTTAGKNVTGRVFGVVTITYDEEHEQQPRCLSGSWFDLDGAFMASQEDYWKKRLDKVLPNSPLPRSGTITMSGRIQEPTE